MERQATKEEALAASARTAADTESESDGLGGDARVPRHGMLPVASDAGPWYLVAPTGGVDQSAVLSLSQLVRGGEALLLSGPQLCSYITQVAACLPLAGGAGHVWVVHAPLALAHRLTTQLPPGLTLQESAADLGHDAAPLGGDNAAAPPRPPAADVPKKKLPVGCDAWLRSVFGGEVKGVTLPASATPAQVLAIMGMQRTVQTELALLKPGTVKAACFTALHRAGLTGLTVQELADATQSAGLMDCREPGAPSNAVAQCLMHDPSFVHVGDGRYSLRTLGAAPAWPPPALQQQRVHPAGEGLGEARAVAHGGGETHARCAKLERAARHAMAALQERCDVAVRALAAARAACDAQAAGSGCAATGQVKRSKRKRPTIYEGEPAAAAQRLEAEVGQLRGSLAEAAAALQAAELATDAARGAGPGPSAAQEAAREDKAAAACKARAARTPVDDDELLASETALALAEGHPPPLPHLPPAPPVPGADGAGLADELAVVSFLANHSSVVGVRPVALSVLDATLRRSDGGTALPSLYIGLFLAALPTAGDTVFARRWRELLAADTWPEVLRRFLASRAAGGYEAPSVVSALTQLAAAPVSRLARRQHAALLRALCDAALDSEPVAALLNRHLEARKGGARLGDLDAPPGDADAGPDDTRQAIRVAPLGEDRSRRRYWWPLGGVTGCLFVETPSEGTWAAITRKEDLDALIAALDVRGARECALKAALSKRHLALCIAFEKAQGCSPYASGEEGIVFAPLHPQLDRSGAAATARVWDERACFAAAAAKLVALGARFNDCRPAPELSAASGPGAAWALAPWATVVDAAATSFDGGALAAALMQLEEALFVFAEKPSRFTIDDAAGTVAAAAAAAAAEEDGNTASADAEDAEACMVGSGLDAAGEFFDWAEPNLAANGITRGRQLWQTVNDRLLWRSGAAACAPSAARVAYLLAVLSSFSTPLMRALSRECARLAAATAPAQQLASDPMVE